MVNTPTQSFPVPVQQPEQKVVEKKPEETPPEQTIAEAPEGDETVAQETENGESETITSLEYNETDGNREYEELLAYISSLIGRNLQYPQIARRRNVEGVVGVHFEIGIDGSLVSVRVNHSSVSSILDRAAVSLIE